MRDFFPKAGTKSPRLKRVAGVRRRVAGALESVLRMFADPVRRAVRA